MLLELGKAVSFLVSLLSLYFAAISAFFVPGSRWEDRVALALVKLCLAACICLCSGMLFSWPSAANPDGNQNVISTLPVRLFLWSAAALVCLFLCSWYLSDLARQAAPFISSRSHEGI